MPSLSTKLAAGHDAALFLYRRRNTTIIWASWSVGLGDKWWGSPFTPVFSKERARRFDWPVANNCTPKQHTPNQSEPEKHVMNRSRLFPIWRLTLLRQLP